MRALAVGEPCMRRCNNTVQVLEVECVRPGHMHVKHISVEFPGPKSKRKSTKAFAIPFRRFDVFGTIKIGRNGKAKHFREPPSIMGPGKLKCNLLY
jgi:hypothetical protein